MTHLKERYLSIYDMPCSALGEFYFWISGRHGIKVLENEVGETVSRDQSQEQVEAFALQESEKIGKWL